MRHVMLMMMLTSLLLVSGCNSGLRDHQAFYDDQTLRQEGQLDGYKPVGMWRTYHPDGSLASAGRFVAGRQVAQWRYGHPGGRDGGVGHWRAGVQHGWWELLAADGTVHQRGLMVDGQRLGPWLDQQGLVVHGEPTSRLVDGAVWQLADGSVATVVGHERVAIQARWQDEDWHQAHVVDAGSDKRARLAAYVQPSVAAPTTAAVAVNKPEAADTDAAAAVQADALELTPLPPLIDLGTIGRFFGDRFVKRYSSTADEDAIELVTADGAEVDDAGPASESVGNAAGLPLVGQSLPVTRFIADGGGLIDISQPAKPTVLVIMRGFSGSVCLYCAAQTKALAQMADQFAAAGIDLIVMYPGPVASVAAFKDAVAQLQREATTELPLRIALDVNQQLVRKLDIRGDLSKPSSLIIGTDATIRWAYVGLDMGDRPSVDTLLEQAKQIP